MEELAAERGLHIKLFGGLEIRWDGVVQALPPSKKTRALLAYLVLQGTPQRRDALCELLWDLPDDPRGSLRWSLSKLRPLVNTRGVERLRADREAAVFSREGATVDLLALEAACAAGHEHLPDRVLLDFADASSGTLLAGLDLPDHPAFEGWRLAQQERGRQLRLRLLRALLGRPGLEAGVRTGLLRSWVALEPGDEAAHVDLLRHLRHSGQASDLEAQTALSRRLMSDAGVHPGPGFREAARGSLPASGEDPGGLASPQRPPGPGAGEGSRLERLRDFGEPRCRVAVLPLRNLSPDVRVDLLILEVVEDLTTHLARMPGFLAISPASTLMLPRADPATAAEQLGVRYIIDGSVKVRGDRATVAACLTDTASSAQVWGDQYECLLDELPDHSAHLAREILKRLEPQLARLELERLGGRAPRNLDAWALYRRAQGMIALRPWTGGNLAEAVHLLEEAVAQERGFALGHALLSLVQSFCNMAGFSELDASRERILASAERALNLDEQNSAVLGFAGCAISDVGNPERGLELLERSLELDPCNAQAWAACGTSLLLRGQVERAADCLQHGIRLSPIDTRRAFWGAVHAMALARLQRPDEAMAAVVGACRSSSHNHLPWVVRSLLSARAGQDGDAQAAAAEARRLWPEVSAARMGWLVGEDGADTLRARGLLA